MKATNKLKGRIQELEAELAKAFEEQEEFSKALANAYASGSGIDAAAKKLTESRDKTISMVQALRQLDKKLYITQGSERAELSEKIDKKSKSDFEVAVKKAAQSIKPLRKTVTEYLKETATEAVLVSVLDHLKVALWEKISEKAQEEFLETVPPSPREPLERDDRGQKFEKSVSMIGR